MQPLRRLPVCLLCLTLLAGLGRPALALNQAQLQHALSAYLTHSALSGASVGCEVRTIQGDVLYKYHADRPLIPASNVKLLVSATAVDLFGPPYVFGAQLWAEQAPDKSGVVAGNVFLCGCANPDGSQSALWPLVKALQEKGVKTLTGDVVSTSALAAGDHDHGLKSAKRLYAALGQAGINVKGQPREGFCPRAPVQLAASNSVSLAEYLRQTNKSSENREAQCLLDSLLACFADPLEPDPDFLLRYWSLQGLDTTGLRLDDGSGYSRASRLSPAFLDAVLLRMAASPAGYTTLSHSFPTAGVDGTLQDRMRGSAAEGCVRAKTGTLTGVSCLSGYVERGGQPRLVFSLLINGFSCPVGTARRIEDQVAIRLAEWVQNGSS